MSMKKQIIGLAAALSAAVSGPASAQSVRDYISIVGSSTVYPLATVVVEQFGKTTDYKTPTVESTGSGGGMKLFCAGVGIQYPDIVNASRRIKKSELDTCRKNGVKDVVELKIGYDGIAIANSKKAQPMNFTLRDIFLALAKEVPDPKGAEALVENPKALGILGFSFLDQNLDKIRGSAIGDVKPEFETISDGSYPISRPLYFYVKAAHASVIPGIREYLSEFFSERASGNEGYLTDRGLIPMSVDERRKFAEMPCPSRYATALTASVQPSPKRSWCCWPPLLS
jgi:ABC-type phosphate transport system substrate-binding protein